MFSLPIPLLRRPARGGRPATQALFGFGKKKNGEKSQRELENEEQYRLQQEVLNRRKNNSWQKVKRNMTSV